MNEQTAERTARALESIAESLAKLANPPLMIETGDPNVPIVPAR